MLLGFEVYLVQPTEEQLRFRLWMFRISLRSSKANAVCHVEARSGRGALHRASEARTWNHERNARWNVALARYAA